MKRNKRFFQEVLLICFISFLSIFQIKTFSQANDKDVVSVTNNLLNNNITAVSSKLLEGKESKLVKSEKGIKQMSLGYDLNGMDSLLKSLLGPAAVELKYNTRASVSNVNYLLNPETAHILAKAMSLRDSLLVYQNSLLTTQNNLLLDQVYFKIIVRQEKEIKTRLKAKAHLAWVFLFILSLVLFLISIRIDHELLRYISIRSGVIGLLGTLFYLSDFIWLFINR